MHTTPSLTVAVLQYVFMDMETYNETRLSRDDAWAKYLKEGAVCSLMFYDGKVRRAATGAQQCMTYHQLRLGLATGSLS